jgi:hypothetical protein
MGRLYQLAGVYQWSIENLLGPLETRVWREHVDALFGREFKFACSNVPLGRKQIESASSALLLELGKCIPEISSRISTLTLSPNS